MDKRIYWAIAAVVVLLGAGFIGYTILSRGYIEVHHKNYRIGGAHGAYLGSAGIVRTRLRNKYERQFLPDYGGVAVRRDAIIERELKSDLAAMMKAVLAEEGAEVDATSTLHESAEYHLFSFESKDDIVEAINQDPGGRVFRHLLSTPDTRIVTSVLIGFGHELSRRLSTSSTAAFSTSGGVGELSMESGTGTTERIRFSDGTILAYAYDRACWRIDDQGNGTVAILLTDDPTITFSLGILEDTDCPPGTQSDPPAAAGEAESGGR